MQAGITGRRQPFALQQHQHLRVRQAGPVHDLHDRDHGSAGVEAPERALFTGRGAGVQNQTGLVHADPEVLGGDLCLVALRTERGHQAPPGHAQMVQQHPDLVGPQVISGRQRQIAGPQNLVHGVVLMLRGCPQLVGRQGCLQIYPAGRTGEHGLQDLVGKVDERHHGLGVLAGEQHLRQVGPARPQDVQHRPIARVGLMAVQEPEHVGQIGCRAVDRLAVRAVTGVQRAEQQLHIGHVGQNLGPVQSGHDVRRQRCGQGGLNLGAQFGQSLKDLPVLQFGERVDLRGLHLIDACLGHAGHERLAAQRHDLHRAVQVVVQQRRRAIHRRSQAVHPLQNLQFGAGLGGHLHVVTGQVGVEVAGAQLQIGVLVHDLLDRADSTEPARAGALHCGGHRHGREQSLGLCGHGPGVGKLLIGQAGALDALGHAANPRGEVLPLGG